MKGLFFILALALPQLALAETWKIVDKNQVLEIFLRNPWCSSTGYENQAAIWKSVSKLTGENKGTLDVTIYLWNGMTPVEHWSQDWWIDGNGIVTQHDWVHPWVPDYSYPVEVSDTPPFKWRASGFESDHSWATIESACPAIVPTN